MKYFNKYEKKKKIHKYNQVFIFEFKDNQDMHFFHVSAFSKFSLTNMHYFDEKNILLNDLNKNQIKISTLRFSLHSAI